MSASAVCFIAGATFSNFAIANMISVFVFVLMLVGLYDVFHEIRVLCCYWCYQTIIYTVVFQKFCD